MNILLLGSGGREDALAWRLRQSPSCDRLVAAPGNPGIARWADCVAIDSCDPAAVVALAREIGAGLVVIGPEAPLVAGVADALRQEGIATFGPNAAAAQLEGSKGFTKDLCRDHGIPTADYARVETVADALAALDHFAIPVVIKADGLAAGKGVTVAMSRDEAEAAIRAAGDGPMVIEEFLEGEEASLFALVDGATAIPLATAQDHKRVGEGDTGPNTGGMGAYAPAPVLTADLQQRAMDEIVRPTAQAMEAAGTPFSGILYAGLMLTATGPKLIEYNVRFGDPECEAIMPLIEGDFAELLLAVATGRLGEIEPPRLSGKHAITVIVAARGYPGAPTGGGAIRAIEAAEQVEGVTVFHAGTAREDGTLVARGGRVLAVTAVADSFANARARAYRGLDQIDFADGFHRRDIGWRELEKAGRMSPLMAYVWPSFAAGVVVGAIALTFIFRRRLSGWPKWLAVDGAILAAVLLSLVWSGPLGGGRQFIDRVEPAARKSLDYYEMTQVTALLGRGPLTRELILKGPADDFQRSELVRVMSQEPGVSGASWKGGNGAWPIILEGALMAIAGLLLGALLAYLLELHRRYNAQWNW